MTCFCIVSPSRWATPESIAAAKALLERRGHRVIVHAQNNAVDGGRLAGSDQARADALAEAFRDPQVDVVLAARGGTGALRLLERLDWKIMRAHAKPFAGFSDLTVLLHALHQRAGVPTYHAPVATSLHRDPRTLDDFLAVLNGSKRRWSAPQATVLRAGTATGRLIGGNLTMLQSLIGTNWEWNADGAILFIEEVGEELYRVDRMLGHLKLASKFDAPAAVIFGESVIPDGQSPTRDGDSPFGRGLHEILLEVLPRTIPIVTGFPCGHVAYNTTLPIGATMTLRADASGVALALS